MIRRMIWRNMRALYKRECGLCKKFLISMYSDGAPVYCHDCFYGDKWDPRNYGLDYDFSENFFVQLKELLKIVPRLYRFAYNRLINSDYVNFARDNKNAYLCYSITDCEDVMYSENIDLSKNSLDSFGVIKIDNSSYNTDCENNYNTHWAIQTNNCLDSYFLYDCNNCQNCCLSSNLRNQKYYFENKKLFKGEYEKKVANLHLEKFSGLEKVREDFDKLIHYDTIHKYALIYASQNVTGNFVRHSKNVVDSFDIGTDSESVAFSARVICGKDLYDCQGSNKGEFSYESIAPSMNAFRIIGGYLNIIGCRECEYSLIMKNCRNCFGCVGMTNSEYCLLNKQYSKEEYFSLIERVKKQMTELPYVDVKSRIFKYGEYFQYDLCPFGYNETKAHDIFNLKKEEALKKGYPWKEREKRNYNITCQSSDLPDSIKDVPDEILNEVIACPNEGNQDFQCSSAYRIMPFELQFYRQKSLPLPRYCPNFRHYQRLKYRNPYKLWHRKCMHEGCQNEFETSYAPERPEIVYCERCYNQEVY